MNIYALIDTHVVLIVCGSGVLFFVIRGLIESIRNKSWSSMLGTIESSEIKTNYGSIGEGSISFVDIEYSYVVKNIQYSSTVHLTGALGIYPSVNSIQKKYPIGKIIPVYVKPQFPETSRLKTGVTFRELAFLLLILLLSLTISRDVIVVLLIIGIAVILNIILWIFNRLWKAYAG